MKRTERLLKIIQLLRRHRRPVTGVRIAEELEISLRTLYRDIADLIADGVPVRGEAGVGYVLSEGYDLPPLMFKPDELEAIMLGLGWVAARGDKILRDASADAVAKIGAVLPQNVRPNFYDAPLITLPGQSQSEDRVDVAAIRRAIRARHKLGISYFDVEGRETQRVIWPIAISYFDLQRMIIAWCELREGFRSFRTDRIAQMDVLEGKYRESRLSLLEKWKQACAREEGEERLMNDV